MSEERFVVGSNEIGEIIVTDVETDRVYRYGDISKFFGLISLLNEQQATISALKEENEQLKEQLSLVCKAECSAPYNSVKEVLRRQIFGLDCAAEESPNAWHHYRILCKLFEEQYDEYWDNDD